MVIIILHLLLLLLLGFLPYSSLLKLVSVHWGNHTRLSLAKSKIIFVTIAIPACALSTTL